MNNRKEKPNQNFSSFWAILAAIIVFNVIASEGGSFPVLLIVAVVVLAIAGLVFGLILAQKKKGGKKFGSVYHAERMKDMAKSVLHAEKRSREQAVGCSHERGKDKYIQQLDNFLSNGLIEKSEYMQLKRRYESLNIPENMH